MVQLIDGILIVNLHVVRLFIASNTVQFGLLAVVFLSITLVTIRNRRSRAHDQT